MVSSRPVLFSVLYSTAKQAKTEVYASTLGYLSLILFSLRGQQWNSSGGMPKDCHIGIDNYIHNNHQLPANSDVLIVPSKWKQSNLWTSHKIVAVLLQQLTTANQSKFVAK